MRATGSELVGLIPLASMLDAVVLGATEVDLDLHPAVYRKAKAAFDAAHAPLVAERQQAVESVAIERLRFGGALDLDEPAV